MDEFKKIVEKIFGVLGYDIYESFIKVYFDSHKKIMELKLENEISLKRKVFENSELSLEQKVKINAVLGKNLNSFMREIDILGIALNKLDKNAQSSNLDSDWLLDFFDKASRITENDTKEVWGTLLAEAASDREICSKTLLNSLYLMGSDDISSFLNVCRFTLSEKNLSEQCNDIISYPIIFFSKNVKRYNASGISSFRLNRLQRLGLIEIDYKSEYIFSENVKELIYNNQVIKVESEEKIKIGNIRFSQDGFLLYKISEKIYNNNLLNDIIEVWRKRNYTIYINGRMVSQNK